jgi:2,3-diketo-5-methylthio-1-phosphopentane phosphatase
MAHCGYQEKRMTAPATAFISGQIPQDWRIICDFDGTITPFDVTDALLTRFAHPSWEEVEEEWLAGRITARACMARQVRLLDAPIHLLDAFLDTVPLTEGFVDFTQSCAALGLSCTVVSDGLDYAIKRILSRHGVRDLPVIANRLRRLGAASYTLEFPFGREGCASGVCKCGVAQALNGKSGRILLIGDGHSDCCLAGISSLVLARQGKELHRRCVSAGYPHLIFTDFYDVAAHLAEIAHPQSASAAATLVAAHAA